MIGLGRVKARFGERFLAFLIDVWLFTAFYFASMAGLLFILGRDPGGSGRLILGGFWYVLFCLYGGFSLSRTGQTLGKRLLGLAVVDENGGRVSFALGLFRMLGYLPSSIFNLGFLWALRADGRAWHDHLAGTRVVESREKSALVRTLLLLTAWGLGLCLAAAWILIFVVGPA